MPDYVLIVLETTHETMALEDWLKAHCFWHEVIPKPAKAKTECGLALKIKGSEGREVLRLLRNEKFKIKNLFKVKKKLTSKRGYDRMTPVLL